MSTHDEYYNKLEEMDDRLVLLATRYEMDLDNLKRIHDKERMNLMMRHNAEEQELMYVFYEGMEEVMQDYREAIDYDIAQHKDKNS